MSDLYDEDILLWSERQAALLRRVAAGERINDFDLDLPNIIEEVESVGRSEWRACESLLVQALCHILKVRAWPHSPAVPGWTAEIRRFRDEAAAAFTPSMRQRIDIARLYARALRAMPSTVDGSPGCPVPPTCFTTLDDVLDLQTDMA